MDTAENIKALHAPSNREEHEDSSSTTWHQTMPHSLMPCPVGAEGPYNSQRTVHGNLANFLICLDLKGNFRVATCLGTCTGEEFQLHP